MSRRSAPVRPLLALALFLQVLHVVVLTALPHPVFASNIVQLCCPILALVVCVQQALSTESSLERRCWHATASAFGIWIAAQAMFVYYLSHPCQLHWAVRPDDALWVLFGLPLLLAATITQDEADKVAWLDRAQALLFFLVLYSLVFLAAGVLQISSVYLIQNLALILCCFLRLPVCVLARERRFFLRLTLFLVAYGGLECVGEHLYSRGWKTGSLADLVWTLPFTFFLVLTLHGPSRSDHFDEPASRWFKAVRTMQGISIATMAFWSMGLAGLLTTRQPKLGGFFVAGSFFLFAIRTNLRERLWGQAHERLEETLLRDALTGVGNRLKLVRMLQEHLASSRREQVVMLFADLDRFKQINDSLGHVLGDRLLIEVARRLSATSAHDAVVCRLGGDEFVVLTWARNAEEAVAEGNALLKALHLPFQVGPHELRTTASIGVVLAAPGENADLLLRTADQAMYRAKQLGKARVQFFDAELRAEMKGRWHMEAELRACVDANAIQVAFQPIYSVEQQQICGFEALARWNHPLLGEVPPSDFIALAEESGLILTLGSQILEKACAQMANWNAAWGTSLSISVNMSPRQFTDTGLLPCILGILDRTSFPANLLRLEITETALLTHAVHVKHTLEQARTHGIRISLDDFGTGYSSLSFLLSLPVDEVKVDRSFVSHMHADKNREEVVRTVIHLGHSLGKRVVAEGVETEKDLSDLTEMGCECVQGYLISKPFLPEALEANFPFFASRGLFGVAPEDNRPEYGMAEEASEFPEWTRPLSLKV